MASCSIRLRWLTPTVGRLRGSGSPKDADAGLAIHWSPPRSDRCPSRRADSNVILLAFRVCESGSVAQVESVMMKLCVFIGWFSG